MKPCCPNLTPQRWDQHCPSPFCLSVLSCLLWMKPHGIAYQVSLGFISVVVPVRCPASRVNRIPLCICPSFSPSTHLPVVLWVTATSWWFWSNLYYFKFSWKLSFFLKCTACPHCYFVLLYYYYYIFMLYYNILYYYCYYYLLENIHISLMFTVWKFLARVTMWLALRVYREKQCKNVTMMGCCLVAGWSCSCWQTVQAGGSPGHLLNSYCSRLPGGIVHQWQWDLQLP